MQRRSLSSWDLCRVGIVMEPDPADPREAEGVLNPAVARGPDGHLHILPRLVAAGNYSRIGLARVVFDRHGDPVGVERHGVVLEPRQPYECNQPQGVCYSAGLLLLDLHDPRRVLYRSARSILQPRTRAERQGTVPRVVFPTGVDAREDGALDVYYGMADSRIGVARATLTGLLRTAMAPAA